MKTLLLLRHGEAADPVGSGGDKTRTLTRKGRADMAQLHYTLRTQGLMPAFALSSDAERTRQTLDAVTGPDFAGQKILDPHLYNADFNRIVEAIQNISDEFSSAMIVAHNPGIHMVAMNLIADSSDQTLQMKLLSGYSSGTLTVLQCPVDRWSDIDLRRNHLARLIVPA